MPVHQFVNDCGARGEGPRRTTGATTPSPSSPRRTPTRPAGSAASRCRSSRRWCKTLHAAGIEVILDVVYNHTAEGNHLGPTLSMRGIDNEAYYRLEDDDKRYYTDYTGTGNSLNVGNPHTLQLIMDSLRYWVLEMHVDGFRFDLASTLAREFYEVDRLAAFFELVQQDPVVSQVKLIAEPWDVGPGGYQVGNFPPQWTEWNGKYRDTVRDFWRGEPQTLGEFASRLTGLGGPLRALGAPARGIHQLRHGSRRLHAARSRVVQREAQRGQRRGQPGRGRRQPLLELRRRGTDRRPGGADAARTPAAQLHRHAAAVAGRARCCCTATSSAARRAGTTTATRRTTRSPGSTGAPRPAAPRVHGGPGAAAPRAPDVPPPALLRRPPGAPRGGRADPRHRVGAPGRHRRCSRRTGTPDSAVRSRCSSTATASASATAGASRSRTTTSSCCSTPETSAMDFHIPAVEFSPEWDVIVDTAGVHADTEPIEPGSTLSVPAPLADGAARARRFPSRRSTTPSPRRSRPRPPSDSTTCPEPHRPQSCVTEARRAMPGTRPASTYRLQIRPAFDPRRRRRAARLPERPRRRLGVPLAAAAPRPTGSDHGYDVVDPTAVDPARGGSGGARARLAAAATTRASASWSTSSRTTSASRAPTRTRGGGTC